MEEFKKDMTPLDKGQMNAVKYMTVISQMFAERIERIMKQYGMWEKGFRFMTTVNPDLKSYCKAVEFRREVVDGEAVFTEQLSTWRGNGEFDDGWQLQKAFTSREFIHLFDKDEDDAGEKEGTDSEKPFPPSGLWIGAADNDTYVAHREWDINDSLS